jgi:hypothetical protein
MREYIPAGQRHSRILLVAARELQQPRLGKAVDDPADATPVDRAGAHCARLCAGVHRARAQISTVEPPARDTHQVRFRMPGDVVPGDDGVFRLGGDDASSVNEERTKRVVSAAPGARGQVYGGTQVGNLCGVRSSVMSDLLGGRVVRRPRALLGGCRGGPQPVAGAATGLGQPGLRAITTSVSPGQSQKIPSAERFASSARTSLAKSSRRSPNRCGAEDERDK